MSKSFGPIFRKSVGGYNKSDVNTYIEDISIRHKSREEELESIISKLEKKLEETEGLLKEAQSRDFSEEAEVYTKQIEELETKVVDGTNIIAAKNEYIEKLEAENSVKDTKIFDMESRLKELEENSASANELLEKAKQYDLLSRRLGDLMLKAGDTAEKIVSDANQKAFVLISEAESKRAHCLEVLKNYTEKYCDKLSEVTVATAQERLDRINSEMAQFEASLSRSVMDARRQSGSMKEYIDTLRKNLDTSLDNILSETQNENPGKNDESVIAMDKILDNSVNDILSQIRQELDGGRSV
ncbi:MAG: hypothetical protein E7635_01860 [Ruminococcaceae bacterium]|nr:hypothetical protein [Oscillospiraceae bacterium]